MRSKSWGFVKAKNNKIYISFPFLHVGIQTLNTINDVQMSFLRRNLTLQFPHFRGGN